MVEVEQLRKILKTCTNEEMLYVRNLALSGDKEKEPTKLSKLLELSIDYEVTPDIVYKILYPRKNAQAFKKLIQRLENLVLNAISQQDFIQRYPNIDFKNREILLIRKEYLINELLWMRGVNILTLKKLDSMISKLIKLQQYEFLLQVLKRKRTFYSFHRSRSEYEALNKEIKYYRNCNSYLSVARELFETFNSNLYLKYYLSGDNLYLSKIVNKLERFYVFTKSVQMHHYLTSIRTTYLINLGELNRASLYLDEHISILKDSKWNYSYAYHMNALMNLALVHFRMFNLVIGRKFLNESSTLIHSHTNLFIYELMLSQSYFYDWNESRLNSMISQMKSNYDSYPIPANWRIQEVVLRSSQQFVLKNYKEAISVLNGYKFKEEDREGWHFYFKLLKIMCLIELEKFDLATASIESFRKQLERGNKPTVRMARWVLIKRLLLSLSRNSFRFKTTVSKNKEVLLQLSGSDMKYRWLIMSPEMIPFQEWIVQKSKGESYDHLAAMQLQSDIQHQLNRKEEMELEQDKIEHAEYPSH